MTLPKSWTRCVFEEVADLRNGINYLPSEDGKRIKVLGVGDFGKREVISDFTGAASVKISFVLREGDFLKDNDLLFVRSNGSKALVGRCALLRNVHEKLSFSGFTIRARIRSPDVDPLFISKVMRSELYFSHLRTVGGGSSINNLSQAALGSLVFPLPPYREQRKIAEVLSAWDDAIVKERSLRELYQHQYAALTNRLMAPTVDRRAGGSPMVRLSDVTRELKRRNSDRALGRTQVMGVSNRKGLFPMREQTKANDLARYKVLPPRGFAYNPMRINVGSIAMSLHEEDVLMSPDYVLFECDGSLLMPDFFRHVTATEWWAYQVNAGGSGSVRSRTYYDDLAALQIPLPSVDEQKRLCGLLDCVKRMREIAGHQAELLEKQKRGVMQKLLTGQIRVNVSDDIDRAVASIG